MKAPAANLLTFLQKSPQIAILVCQPDCSWTTTPCRQLWADVLRTGRSAATVAHIIGTMASVQRRQEKVVAREPMMVIDGH